MKATTVAKVCKTLIQGAQGPDQPANVKRHLKELERNGFATYSEKVGWLLTPKGMAEADFG